jgi:phosphoribosylglycinamide formyltransferase 1
LTSKVAVFASGRGSNFAVLADHEPAESSWEVALLISDRDDAPVLERARERSVRVEVIPTAGRAGEVVGREILHVLEDLGIHLVLLAGFLRLIPPAVVDAYRGRMLNLHPALLPSFGGKGMYGRRVHEAVLEAGVRITGATVHLVDERYDRGRILAQWPVPVLEDDSAESLAARVNAVEHRLFPAVVDRVVRALAEGGELPTIPGPRTPSHAAFSLSSDAPEFLP